jgi:hypothetical protein
MVLQIAELLRGSIIKVAKLERSKYKMLKTG